MQRQKDRLEQAPQGHSLQSSRAVWTTLSGHDGLLGAVLCRDMSWTHDPDGSLPTWNVLVCVTIIAQGWEWVTDPAPVKELREDEQAPWQGR